MHGEGTRFGIASPGRFQGPSTIALLTMAVAGLYLVLHPYLGITHDARLYTLQALNHLHPELYGNDVFLRFGSQDDYTLFTPVFAWMIAWLGVEPAASLLTLVSQLTFVTAGALLCRALLPTASVWAAVALLLILPDHYGPWKIFSYFEGFLTPRLLAESFVMFGLTAFLNGWRKLSGIPLTLAMLVHPIIGLAGIAAAGSLTLVLPHWRKLWPAAVLASLSIALVMAEGVPTGWSLDEEWLGIVLARAEYLHLGNWTADDWGRLATVAATLLISARVLRGRIQSTCLAVLISASALMLLAWIGGDLLNIKLVVQAQPWRVLWLTTVIAIITLPLLVQECWRAAGLVRWGVVLLAAAWLSPAESIALLVTPLAVAGVIWDDSRVHKRMNASWLLSGAYLVPVVLLVHALAVSLLATRTGTFNVSASPWLDMLRNASAGGLIPLAFLIAAGWLIRALPRAVVPGLAAAFALPVAVAASTTANTWRSVSYDKDLKETFATWRARIPPGSDVMWTTDSPAGADSATNVWLLLERPSFVSRSQAATSLFSREAALEMRHRARSLLGLLPDAGSLYPPDVDRSVPDPLTLAPVCRMSTVRYIVTSASFVDAVPIQASPHVRTPFRNLKLYICP